MWTKAKDVISDLLGLGIIIATTVAIFLGKINVLWEGIAVYVVGAIFFFISDEGIAKGLQRFVNKIANGKKEE